MAILNFNAEEVEPSSYDPLPEGNYQAVVTASEMKPTKNKDGAYLELAIEIINGPYQGRKLWDRLNLQNRNPQAATIAQQQLAALCRAINVMKVTDSSQLHNMPFMLKVKCKPRDDGDGLANVVKGYASLPNTDGSSAFAASSSAGQTEQNGVDEDAAPWGDPQEKDVPF